MKMPFSAVLLAAVALTQSLLAEPPAPRKLALLVGVSTYEKAGLADKPLPYAAPDMELLAKELRDADWSVVVLKSKGTDNTATRIKIEAALDKMLENVNAADLVIVALSGHGQQFRAKVGGATEAQEEAFFCPSDGVPGEPATLLGMTELLSKLGKKGGTNLVMVDACRDDPRRSTGVDGNAARNVPANTAILFSCAARQQSFETNRMYGENSLKGHGVFFHRVWKGLKGEAKNRQGEVTWDHLVEYVKGTVNDDAVKWFPERVVVTSVGEKVVQTPHSIGSLVGKSPVLVGQDLFLAGSVWVSDKPRQVLAVLQRDGKTFRARFEAAGAFEREVRGTVRGANVAWLAKDVQVVGGSQGGDNEGTIGADERGDKIDFRWRTGGGASGTFTLRLQAPAADAFRTGTVWVGEGRQVLTVRDRDGQSFRARFQVGDRIEREVRGTVRDGKVSWRAEDVRNFKGGRGGDNEGTLTSDGSGDRIDFTWKGPDGSTGSFTLRRDKVK